MRREAWRPVLAAALLFLGAASSCRCPDSGPRPAVPDAEADDPADRPSSLELPAREPGPPRPEPPEVLARARGEARALVAALLKGGIARREVASMADIRGYRLYRRRFFGQARVWFEAAADADPTYEPGLYNAARAAALLDDREAATRHLAQLRRLGTPLARARLEQAQRDPDLVGLGSRADDGGRRR